MKHIRLMLCRSQSEAMVLSRKLSSCGICCTLTRPPLSPKVKSCTWGIAVAAAQAGQAETCLEQAGAAQDIWCWEDDG